jgi:cytochrome c-type biogenesis protein
MLNSIIAHLQIFGIGFSFGIIGPCFLVCTPVLITYVVGSKRGWADVLKDIIIFLSGRLLAYVVLGFLAGLSGSVLRSFASSSISSNFQPLAGAITIFFAFIILLNRDNYECTCTTPYSRILNFGGIFTFGLLLGLSPCAPLLALLFDIVLVSKSALDGAFYTLSFGLGTFLSGLITVGIIAGILTRIPAALVKSKAVNTVFKAICAMLLMALGLGLILRSYRI